MSDTRERLALDAASARAPSSSCGRPWLPPEEGDGRPPVVSEQHAAARFWASRGLPVCRLIARDKRPTDRAPKTSATGPHHRLASTDLDVIDRWWLERHPYWGSRARCNPGLPTGAWPGVLALDVDHPAAFERWADSRPLPPTLRWSSCRPDHPERHTLLFTYPAVRLPIRSVVDGRPLCIPGVDLRADGEHVVLPGAVHASGSVYTIQRDHPLADLPAWLVNELRRRFACTPTSRPTSRQLHERRAGTHVSAADAPPIDASRQAYANALRLFARAADAASTAPGQRHRVLVGLAWEGLARGLRTSDVRRAALLYVERACPERHDRLEALRQLDDALARPKVGSPNEPRFTVEGQMRWLLEHDPRWRPSATGTRPCAGTGGRTD